MNAGSRSAHSIAADVRARRCSVREIATQTLAGIENLDSQVGAFLRVDRQAVLRAAERLDARIAGGDDSGTLLGVPVALKDNLLVAGEPTTAGSRILEGFIAPYDAHVVERLRAAGALLIGKTNLDEFAMGSSTEHSAYGVTRNPWALDRTPGGSSGGSAAAVAAGMVPLALGSDTGGSIRQPAAFTGCVGFKPTYGRVSRYGLIAFASSLDQIGPLARSVADTAACYLAIAGHDARDATSRSTQVDAPALDRSVAGRRIGVHRDYLAALPDREVRSAIERVLEKLRDGGAHIVALDDIDLLTEHALSIYYVIANSEASSNLSRFDGLRYGPRHEGTDLASTYAATRGDCFGREVRRRILLGTFALSAGHRDAYYNKAQLARTALRQAYHRAFERVDAIVGATAPMPAFPLGERTEDPLTMYLADTLTVPASLAGLPAVALPAGITSGGLPIGVQVIGNEGHDARVLEIAAAIERDSGYVDRSAPLGSAP